MKLPECEKRERCWCKKKDNSTKTCDGRCMDAEEDYLGCQPSCERLIWWGKCPDGKIAEKEGE